MRRLPFLCLFGVGLLAASTVWAQTPQAPPKPPAKSAPAPATGDEQDNERRATPTVNGDTGLWFVPTAEALTAKKWSFSGYRVGTNDGQGFTNISNGVFTASYAMNANTEVFGSWNVVTRIDRDSRPLFFTNTVATAATGTGGGLDPNYPLDRTTFTGNKRGDLWLGLKMALPRQTPGHRWGFGFRELVKIPKVGDKNAGVSSGRIDAIYDGILSTAVGRETELSGYFGFMMRGPVAGYTLTNSFRYGVGAGFMTHRPVHFTAELFGEHYRNDVITAPAGLFGTDGSAVPTSTTLKDPLTAALGITFENKKGFFIGGGVNWNLSMKGRSDAAILGCATCSFSDLAHDAWDLQFRIGYRPRFIQPLPPPPPPPPAPPTPAPPQPRPNRPPTVTASCDPCTVEVGKTSTVSADGQDPDGDPLTYQWRTPSGSLTSPAARQSPWTAPMQEGPVTLTVTVDDGKGGTASATTTIQVVKPPKKEYVFEDVHFDFDRYTLRADALRVLDEAVAALQADATLKIEIEGHTCNIGTAEYNLALGERRAKAVLEYLTSRGVGADRLRTVSYGEERPKYDNSREETRRLNRRAALVVRLTGH